ncbi:MAG TPA: nucleotide exchange factor GrpE [Gemmatimonadaceae bacterium]|nr:nucleotide exchange factor GrpE [Gemmatimonadaceae bacterium]
MQNSDNESAARSGDEGDEPVAADAYDRNEPAAAEPDASVDQDGRAAAERELAEQRDRYLRLAAEYDNYRKRMLRERQEAATRGQSDMLRGMLDALDDLARFAHVDPATTDTTTVVEGAAMVERKLLKTLGSLGLELVNPVDQTFDPATMEAVATEPALSPEDDHVVARVFQVGYVFNGQLLRPARVVVKQWNG